ncbi:MAG: hypothetical protein HN831_04175 [Waddliaceae bacterium]|nr:hypothetical protein [Waddliaceae bacterium]MBT6928089.1 hypothetical protein [Waddliaceae bacterium]MBT7264650.1 hypothetical protein [Waddliaceae bacterium]
MTKTIETQEKELDKIRDIIKEIKECSSIEEKSAVLDSVEAVKKFISKVEKGQDLFANLSAEEGYAVKSVMAIGQGPVVFRGDGANIPALKSLVRQLCDIEAFYNTIGGIIGYHYTVMSLLSGDNDSSDVVYHAPEGLDLAVDTADVRKAIIDGIAATSTMGELYPIGGAGDRLGLVDKDTGESLPAAKLCFGGHTLLEAMIRDVEGREYLYYKLFGERVITPIAMMTSSEKDNDAHIRAICEGRGWFGRPKDSFVFFKQPMAPVITEEGSWSMKDVFTLNLKPGGHGVLWKLAKDNKVFDWMRSQGRRYLLVRQVNNPVAGVDNGIIGLIGAGVGGDKAYGVASCRRVVGTAEGMAVMAEREKGDKRSYGISNVEYTDFIKRDIADAPYEEGSIYSKFPTNTNILFVGCDSIEEAIKKSPFPGMVINMKKKGPYYDSKGSYSEVHAGRLESSMQNIADVLDEEKEESLPRELWGGLKTFVTYNTRHKTISVTKNSYTPGNAIIETPAGCFCDTMKNMYDLLTSYCGMEIPAMPDEKTFVKGGPSFICRLHPAMGPLYDVIKYKIRKGRLDKGAEMVLEIAEVDVENIVVEGSMIVRADNIVGEENVCGKCILKDVVVKNKGIDTTADNAYWENDITRKECLKINLHGNAEFIAEGVTFVGDETIDVAAGKRIRAYYDNGTIAYEQEDISAPTWSWKYSCDDRNNIILTKKATEK